MEKRNTTWKQHKIKPNITYNQKKKKRKIKKLSLEKPLQVTGPAMGSRVGVSVEDKGQWRLEGDGLSCHKPASYRAVLLQCRWTEGPCNDNRKTHLSSEKVTNELIHAAYKLFTTTLTPLKTNSKVNFKYRNPEPPVLLASACKTFCNQTDTSPASAPLLNSLQRLGLLFLLHLVELKQLQLLRIYFSVTKSFSLVIAGNHEAL